MGQPLVRRIQMKHPKARMMKQRGYIFTGKQSISITEQKGRVEGIGKQFAALGRRNRKNGICLTGGVSRLPGLDRYIEAVTGYPVHVAAKPLSLIHI